MVDNLGLPLKPGQQFQDAASPPEDGDEDAICDVCEMPFEDCVCEEFDDAGNGDDEDGQYA